MGSWSLPTTAAGYEADFGRRYEAYAQMLKNQGVKGEELKTRLGNYSKELQKRMQTIPGNKAVGREFAREIAQQKSVTNQLHQALNGKGVTPANFSTTYGNLNHLYAQGPVGNVAGEFTTTYGSAEQLRNAAPTGNIAPETTGQKPAQRITYSKIKEGVNKGKWGVFADGKLQSVHDTKTQANNAFNELRGTPKAPKAPVIKGSSAVFSTADGNAYAKMLEENPIKGNTPTQPKGLTPEAKIALDNARRAEAGARFQGTSQQAMNELHGSKFTGHDLANDLRLQEKGVSILDKHGACEYKGQKYPSLAEFQKANPGVSIRQAELAKVTDPSQLSLVENQKVTNYRNAMQQQGLEGAKLDEQVNRYKEGLKHDRTKRFNKLKGQNNAKILAEAKVVAENTDDAVKGSKGFWGKLWKGVKNNKGKIGLAAAAVAVTATAIGLTQCSDDKKATSVDNKDNKDNKNDSTTVKKNDVPKQAAQGANGELKAGQPVFVDGQFHVVKKGECPWSIAADILQKQGKTDNASILKLTQKIMSNNKLKFENDEGLVIIHPNDTLDVRG